MHYHCRFICRSLLFLLTGILSGAQAEEGSITEDTSATVQDRRGVDSSVYQPATDKTARPDSSCQAGAFAHKLLFTETPAMGRRWRGGFRMHDLLAWDGYINLGGVVLFDCFFAGMPEVTLPDSGGDTLTIKDNMLLLALKGPPLTFNVGAVPWTIGAGVKWYRAAFLLNNTTDDYTDDRLDRSLGFFCTQNVLIRERLTLHLYSSFYFRTVNKNGRFDRLRGTYYLVPGFRFSWGRRKNWSLAAEYFLMNPTELPLKVLQYALTPNNMEFLNLNKEPVSWLFWGIQFRGRRFYGSLALGHHPTFSRPIFPLLGVGISF